MVPFILRFANKLPPTRGEILRYDAERQIAQVLEGGKWVDRVSAGGQESSTRVTAVHAETTDDA